MKKVLFTILLCLSLGIISQANAQAPRAINYQAIARDNSGKLLASTKISVRMNILKGSTSGTNVYQETFKDVSTNSAGQFNLMIGTGSTSNSFSSIDWGSANHFLQIEVDVNNGTNYSVIGSQQLISVPYALFSQKTGDISDKSLSDLKDVKGTPSKGQVLKFDGTSWNVANDSVGGGASAFTFNTFSYNNSTGVITITLNGTSKTITINEKADDLSDNNLSDLKNVSKSTPKTGQVLKYNGSNWVPANDSIGGGSGSSYWSATGSDIYYTSGKVGIGTKTPGTDLQLVSTLTTTKNVGANFDITGSSSGTYNVGTSSIVNAPSSTSVSNVFGSTSQGFANAKYPYVFGLVAVADSSSNVNRAVVATTSSTGFQNLGLWAKSSGVSSYSASAANYGVYGIATGSGYQNIGLVGYANGTGKFNYGTYTISNNSNGQNNIGIYTEADSGSTINYGIYAQGPNSSYKGYAGYFNGDVYTTGSYKTSSDARLKKDVNNLTSALGIINQLSPKTYHYKIEEFPNLHFPKELQYGFLAQDLEKVLPSLVTEGRHKVFVNDLSNTTSKFNDGKATKVTGKEIDMTLKEVNYQGLIPVLTEAIKEQQAIINTQQSKIDDLTKRLESLEKRIK